MNNPHMPVEGIHPWKSFLFYADLAAVLLLFLFRAMDSVLVTLQVICPAECNPARHTGGGDDSITPVRMTRLMG